MKTKFPPICQCHPPMKIIRLSILCHSLREITTKILLSNTIVIIGNRKLAENSGEHILVQPMSILANTLAFMKQYQEAFGLWEECIRITERHVGRSHESLVEILLNYGIGTYVSGGRIERAKELIDRSVGILQDNHFPVTDQMYARALQYLDIFQKKMAGSEL